MGASSPRKRHASTARRARPRRCRAAGEWRRNPYVLPYAWATDQEGWRLLTATPDVLRCHANEWEARYHSGGLS